MMRTMRLRRVKVEDGGDVLLQHNLLKLFAFRVSKR